MRLCPKSPHSKSESDALIPALTLHPHVTSLLPQLSCAKHRSYELCANFTYFAQKSPTEWAG